MNVWSQTQLHRGSRLGHYGTFDSVLVSTQWIPVTLSFKSEQKSVDTAQSNHVSSLAECLLMSCAIILSQHSSHVMHNDISAHEKMHRRLYSSQFKATIVFIQSHCLLMQSSTSALPSDDAVLSTCPGI